MGKCTESLQKNSLKQNIASHNNVSWYTGTDGFLECSPSGVIQYYTLHKIIPGFGGYSLCICLYWYVFVYANMLLTCLYITCYPTSFHLFIHGISIRLIYVFLLFISVYVIHRKRNKDRNKGMKNLE